MITFSRIAAASALLLLLTGCGLYTPQKDLVPNTIDPSNGMSREGKIESNIIANIRCEVTKGLFRAISTGNVPWLAGWGASISLNLTWDDMSSVNPNILYTSPVGLTETFSAGAGFSGSAHSTRNEDITFTLENKTLLQEAILDIRSPQGLDCSALQDGVTVSAIFT